MCIRDRDKIVRRNGELQLVAFHKDPSQPDLVIGTTTGISENQPSKIVFNPGWRITKRVHQGQTLDHLYISGSSRNAAYSSLPNLSNSTTALNNALQSNVPNNIPSNIPTATPSLDNNSLLGTVNQMYGTFVNPLLNTVVGSIATASSLSLIHI